MRIRDISGDSAITRCKAEQILDRALLLLEKVGIAVPEEALRERILKKGLIANNDRILLPRAEVLRYLKTLHIANQDFPATRLTGKVGIYASRWAEPDGSLRYLTHDTLVQQTRFCQALAEQYGFEANAPGYAHDVPYALESLHKYWISCLWCGKGDPEPSSTISADYLFEMAEVMGSPIRRLPLFPPSPLMLAGSSVQSVIKHASKLESAYVYTMSMMGITTPMSITDGFAVNLAETLGCAYLVHAVTGIRVDIRPNLLPFDLRRMSLGYGSVEKFMLELMSAELYAELFHEEFSYRSTNVHTMAKRCSIQSCFERGSLMAMGILYGAKRFYCIGSLALDEIFSPLQLIVDLQMMRQLERTLTGFQEPDGCSDDVVSYVRDNLRGGFINTDLTLDGYKIIGDSGIFDRSALSQWLEGDRHDALDNARAVWEALNKQEDSEKHVTPEQDHALAAVYASACRELQSV